MGYIIPEKVWETLLTGGQWAAVSIILFLSLSTVIAFLGKALLAKDAVIAKTRRECDADRIATYEDRIKGMERLLERVTELVARCDATISDSTRVSEARSDVVRELAASLKLLVTTYELNNGAFKEQTGRIERTIADLLHIVRPGPGRNGPGGPPNV
jgi:hypothetical protein